MVSTVLATVDHAIAIAVITIVSGVGHSAARQTGL